MNIIGAWERAQGFLPVFGAYQGIVTLMHVGGMTDHRIFGLPLHSDNINPGTHSLHRGSHMGELHRASSMYGIDECFCHR